MELNDIMLVAIRWAHALAGAAWVGGGLFYLLVLRPSLSIIDDQSYLEVLKRDIAEKFKEVVELSVVALVVTGVILAFDRLSNGSVSNLYVAVLALKVALAGGMFMTFWSMRNTAPVKTKSPETLANGGTSSPQSLLTRKLISPSQIILVLGALLFFLADVLKIVFEKGLRTP